MQSQFPDRRYRAADKYGMNRGATNWIVGGVMLAVFVLVKLLFPAMSSRTALLIALIGGFAASAVIYAVKKKKADNEERDELKDRNSRPPM